MWPSVELTDARRRLFAEQPRELFLAQAASGLERVGEVMGRVVRRLFAERHGHRHLRHDGGTAATDEAAIDEQRLGAGACRGQCGIHASRA